MIYLYNIYDCVFTRYKTVLAKIKYIHVTYIIQVEILSLISIILRLDETVANAFIVDRSYITKA